MHMYHVIKMHVSGYDMDPDTAKVLLFISKMLAAYQVNIVLFWAKCLCNLAIVVIINYL